MRTFSIGAVLLSFITLIAALINQFHFLPLANSLKNNLTNGMPNTKNWAEVHHFSVMLGEIVLFAGAAALVFCIIPAITIRSKTASAGALFSLTSVFFGLMQGTHMFF